MARTTNPEDPSLDARRDEDKNSNLKHPKGLLIHFRFAIATRRQAQLINKNSQWVEYAGLNPRDQQRRAVSFRLHYGFKVESKVLVYLIKKPVTLNQPGLFSLQGRHATKRLHIPKISEQSVKGARRSKSETIA